MKKYLLAHDLGTSGNKATLFSTDGRLIDAITYLYDTKYYNSNWAEQSASDWWKAVCESTKEIVKKVDPQEIASVSFSGQMMGCLCIDKNGEPLRNAIIWADQRAQKEKSDLESKIDLNRFYRITGHRLSPSYGLQKFMWIKNNEEEIYQNTYKVLNAKDYIVYKMTGKIFTDYTDAVGMTALDINTMQWSDEIVGLAGIDGDKLPRLAASTYSPGGVTKEASLQTGLPEGVPVVMGGGDGLCAALGAGVVDEGITYSYIGSSAWIGMGATKPIFDEKMRTFNWVHLIPGMVTPCGTMQTAGGCYSWIKNELCLDEVKTARVMGVDPYELINREVEGSVPGANGILFLPYFLGERSPRWNPDAKGAFVGIKMESKREDLLRSVLEGITLNLNIILDVFKEHKKIEEILVIGGGARGKIWRQIMADIYNVRINKPVMLEEATSMGAAVVGGVGAGVFKDFTAINNFITIEDVHYPNEKAAKVYDHQKMLFEECYQVLKPFYNLI